MADRQRGEGDDIGRDVGELIGQPLALQAKPHRIGEAEQRAGGGGIERVAAPEHHRDHRDPAAARRHVFGEYRHGAERKLRARETDERARDEHGDDPIGVDVDAERLGGVRLLADAAQPQADRAS